MTPAELLVPRYKVISDFPFNKYYLLGAIIVDDGIGPAKTDRGHEVHVCAWNEFPFVFQKLKWYEERPIGQLPKYVLNTVAKPNVILPVTWIVCGDLHRLFAVSDGYKYYPKLLMPSTEEEYKKWQSTNPQ